MQRMMMMRMTLKKDYDLLYNSTREHYNAALTLMMSLIINK